MVKRHAAALGVVAAAGLFVAVGLVFFGSTGHDDSHITYWASHALAEHGQIVNYNGDRVEQSSSLAQVVLLAIAAKILPIGHPTLGPVSSIVFGVVAIALAARLGGRVVRNEGAFGPIVAGLAAATTPHFVYWGFGGLESTLVGAAACGVVLAFGTFVREPTSRRGAVAGLAIVAYLTARPESPMVLGCLLAVLLAHAWWLGRLARVEPTEGARSPDALRPALILAALGAVATAALIGFRLAYFGSAFPNPVTTKASSIDVVGGLAYLRIHTVPATLWLFVALAVGGVVLGRELARKGREVPIEAVLAVAFGGAYLGFIVLIGGDWMMGGRFLAHMVPMVAVVLAVAIDRLFDARPRARIAAIAVVVASNVVGVVALARGVSSGRPIWTTGLVRAGLDARLGADVARRFSWFETTNLVHLRDVPVVVEMEKVVAAIRAARPDRRVVVMSTQAGMVPYYVAQASYGHLRFIDGCSLVTRDFMPCLPKGELIDHPACRMLGFDKYFRERERIDAACGSERPDVVFALKKRNVAAVLERAGYVIVYEQRGPMRPGADNPFGDEYTFRADELVAVDARLAERAGIAARPAWTWDVGYAQR
jgi:hypothetical protein